MHAHTSGGVAEASFSEETVLKWAFRKAKFLTIVANLYL